MSTIRAESWTCEVCGFFQTAGDEPDEQPDCPHGHGPMTFMVEDHTVNAEEDPEGSPSGGAESLDGD